MKSEDIALVVSLLLAMVAMLGAGTMLGHMMTKDGATAELQRPIVGDLADNAYNDDVLVIRNNFGGSIATYAQRWEAVKQMGLQVIIDGECDSACTHILWQVPPEQVCVTSNARFGFHQASIGGIALPELSQEIDANYPEAVREWLRSQGPLTLDVVYMPLSVLRSIYRECTPMFASGELQ